MQEKIVKLKHDVWAGRGAAGVSAAAPAQAEATAKAIAKAKAKAKATAKATAKAKAKAKATANATAVEKDFYPHEFSEHDRPALSAGRQWISRLSKADVIVVRSLAVVQKAREVEERLPNPLLVAMLFGKRVATPAYCQAAKPGGGTSIKFQPLLKRKFYFFTPRFKTKHDPTLTSYFRRAANALGAGCLVNELDTEENARRLGSQAMVVDTLEDFSNFVRKLVTAQRERAERGTFRSAST